LGTNFWYFSVKIDDGPSPHTNVILDWLKDNGKKATFFVVGQQVVKYPNVLKRVYDEGHEIGLHTWSHHALTSLNTEEIIAEIEWTRIIVMETVGYSAKYIRPPFGDIDNRTRDIIDAMGLIPILWNYDSNDFRLIQNPDFSFNGRMAQRALEYAEKYSQGVISLQHDITKETAAYGPIVADVILKNTTRKIVTLSECLGISPDTKYSDLDIGDKQQRQNSFKANVPNYFLIIFLFFLYSYSSFGYKFLLLKYSSFLLISSFLIFCRVSKPVNFDKQLCVFSFCSLHSQNIEKVFGRVHLTSSSSSFLQFSLAIRFIVCKTTS
jgi:peptidoglycan/xylan/chitin deacetylase (PgdA/CDA1 family)